MRDPLALILDFLGLCLLAAACVGAVIILYGIAG